MSKPIGILITDEHIQQLVQLLQDALDLTLDPPNRAVDRQDLADRLEFWAAMLNGAGDEFDPELLTEPDEGLLVEQDENAGRLHEAVPFIADDWLEAAYEDRTDGFQEICQE